MYILKYFLWLICIVTCFSLDAYAMSADKPESYTLFEYPLTNTILLNSNDTDSDGDGISDTDEATNGTDPKDPCDPAGMNVDVDCDGDGLTNNEELTSIDDPETLAIPSTNTNPDDKCDPIVNNNTNTMAIDLTSEVGNCYYGFNVCAEDENSYPNSCGYDKASVWYTFTTDAQGGDYEIRTTNTSFNNVLTLFHSDLSELVCINDDEFSFGEHSYQSLPANTTYYIMISGAENGIDITEGVFCIEINKIPEDNIPDNQECDINVPKINLINNSEVCVSGSNRYASNADPQPSCNPHPGASVWYEIAAPASGMIQMETFPNFSEVITIYEGTCGSLTEIFCSVNGDDNDGTLIINNLTPEATYYIQVTGNFPTIEADNGQECDDNYIIISTVYDCPTNPPLTDEGSPEPKPCNDNNPNTTNDVWKTVDGNCECAGDCANNPGDICDDGIPNDTSVEGVSAYDFWDDNCNCQSDCPRTPENDCPNTLYIINVDCKCECGEAVGEPCDGSNPDKEYVWSDACECIQNTPGGLGYCPTDITLDAENISNDIYFQTSDYIETDGSLIVEVGEDLTLNAKNYIKLTPGFNAKAESTMRAYILGCEPTVERAEELTTASVKHYPNPFRDEVTLEFKLDLDADVEIMITDVNGKIVSRLSIDNLYPGIQTRSISTQDWVSGIYFYQALIKEQQTGILSRSNGTLVKM